MNGKAALGVPASPVEENAPKEETGRSDVSPEGIPGAADEELGLTQDDLDDVVRTAEEHQGNL